VPRILTLLLLLGCVSCASTSPAPRVRVSGTPQDLAALAGTWSGAYSSGGTGRSGSIRFSLTAESDSARGEVIMQPRRSNNTMGATRQGGMPNTTTTLPQAPTPIRIRFVRASGDSVTGQLASYIDPECGCPLSTTFFGRIKGNSIEGRYESVSTSGGERSNGTWHVKRER